MTPLEKRGSSRLGAWGISRHFNCTLQRAISGCVLELRASSFPASFFHAAPSFQSHHTVHSRFIMRYCGVATAGLPFFRHPMDIMCFLHCGRYHASRRFPTDFFFEELPVARFHVLVDQEREKREGAQDSNTLLSGNTHHIEQNPVSKG